jgi:putative transposase
MVKKCLSRMSWKLSRTVLRRGKGSNPFSLVDYTSYGFKKKLEAQGMTQSMSRVGRCIDNGPMEGYWGILKSERYYLKKYDIFAELVKDIELYIEFYNNRRLQKRLNSLSPMEYRTLAA